MCICIIKIYYISKVSIEKNKKIKKNKMKFHFVFLKYNIKISCYINKGLSKWQV